jgi:hypothetical protein
MQDRIATTMIIRSLQEIADELRALRQQLEQMKPSEHQRDPGPQSVFTAHSPLDDSFGRRLQQTERRR